MQGVGYALGKLGAVANVYNYIDAAHHGWIGWDTNFGPSAQHVLATAAGAVRQHVANVHGFITNTANYSALTEPYFTINTTVNGQPVRQSRWVDWNFYIDELTFAQAFRTRLVRQGFHVQHRHADRHLPQRLGRRQPGPTGGEHVDRPRTRSSTSPASTGASTPATGATRPVPASASGRGPTRPPASTPTSGSSRRASRTARAR